MLTVQPSITQWSVSESMATKEEWNNALGHLKKMIEDFDGLGISMTEEQGEYFMDMLGNLADEIDNYDWDSMLEELEERE